MLQEIFKGEWDYKIRILFILLMLSIVSLFEDYSLLTIIDLKI